MSKFISAVKTFVADEDGVTALEYGLLAALIGVVISVGAKFLGSTISDKFTSIGNSLSAAGTAP
jgi:pilus assembly protein Flp/PilA